MSAVATSRDGIVLGLDEALYHSGPELSSTGAKLILKAPALFRYRMQHPQSSKTEFVVGTAAHKKVLGVGAKVAVIPENMLGSNGAINTTEAKAFVQKARSAGQVPIKQSVADEVDAMAESVLAHREARMLLEQMGDPEVSVFATDPETGVRMRARFDFAPNFIQSDPYFIDLKTIGTSADAETFAKQVADMGYDVQQEHYTHTYGLATGDFSGRMKFIVVEKHAPYLVAVHELSHEFGEIGAARAKHARNLFAEATASGFWRGYEDDPLPLQPPLWHIYQNQELLQ